MKKHKSLVGAVLVLLSILFFMNSCEKVTPDGKAKVLNYDGKSYALTYGTISVLALGADDYDYVVKLGDAANLLSSYKGQVHLLYFRLHGSEGELQSGTYQLKPASQELPSANLFLGTVVDPKAMQTFEFISGEVVVVREGNYYQFSITLHDAAGKVADGYYEGTLEKGDGDGGWDD